MASPQSFKFTPLYGVMGRSPLCYVLQVGELHLLLDCGWDGCLSEELIQPLKEWAPKIDAVLLSHCDMEHLGALPYAVGKLGLCAPIYATLPVQKMGFLLMYDQSISRSNEGSQLLDLDDIDAAFTKIQPLRFQQRKRLAGRCAGVTVTPFCAGHTLGGAVWSIQVGGEELVYAVDYNHRRERHLNGTPLETAFTRPAVLITDAYNMLANPLDRRQRDNKLADTILAALRADGNVLLPVDSAGRALELLLFLDQYWTEKRMVYPLVFLSSQAYNIMEFAKSQLEWMSDTLTRKFERSRDHPNPFETRFLKLMHSVAELEALPPSVPAVVLATGPGLETGLSRELFAQWASEAKNTVIFTETAQPGTVASRVQKHADNSPLQLELSLSKTVPLEGEELAAHEAEKERQKEEERVAEAQQEVDMEQETTRRSSSVVTQAMLMAASLKNQPSLSMELVLRLEDGDAGEEVLIDFRQGEAPKDSVAPMFPDEDPPSMEWDEYGCQLDAHIVALREAARAMGDTDVVMADQQDDEERHPTKVVTTTASVEVKCAVSTFDYEGRTDGRSMRTIVSHVAPRQLVVVNGSPEATDKLAQYCSSELKAWKMVCKTPGTGETVDVSPSFPSFQVEISNKFYPTLHFRETAGSRFCWTNGVLSQQEGEGELPLLMANSADLATGSDDTIFIGDVRLSAVKQALAELGVSAEFNGGVLICSGNVTVSRGGEEGHLVVEGCLSEEYYKVREAVYGQYHLC